MKKKLLTALFLMIFATISAHSQGSKNINRAYGLSISDARGLVYLGTICFYNYSANGPEAVTYYYTNMLTKVKGTASFTWTGNTGTPPNVSAMKARDEALVARQDMKIIYQLLDKNNIPHPNGAGITQEFPQSAANDVVDFEKGN
jgi:hypothetical protein